MQIEQLIPFGITAIGMAFGFGKQAATIATLRRDIDESKLNDTAILSKLNEISIAVAKIEQRV
jgi:hypothetical protein